MALLALALGCWGLAGGMDRWASSIRQLSPTPEADTQQLQMLWPASVTTVPTLSYTNISQKTILNLNLFESSAFTYVTKQLRALSGQN